MNEQDDGTEQQNLSLGRLLPMNLIMIFAALKLLWRPIGWTLGKMGVKFPTVKVTTYSHVKMQGATDVEKQAYENAVKKAPSRLSCR